MLFLLLYLSSFFVKTAKDLHFLESVKELHFLESIKELQKKLLFEYCHEYHTAKNMSDNDMRNGALKKMGEILSKNPYLDTSFFNEGPLGTEKTFLEMQEKILKMKEKKASILGSNSTVEFSEETRLEMLKKLQIKSTKNISTSNTPPTFTFIENINDSQNDILIETAINSLISTNNDQEYFTKVAKIYSLLKRFHAINKESAQNYYNFLCGVSKVQIKPYNDIINIPHIKKQIIPNTIKKVEPLIIPSDKQEKQTKKSSFFQKKCSKGTTIQKNLPLKQNANPSQQ